MKNKTKVISIAIFLSIFMMLVSCGRQKAEWSGTIKEVDGVIVVKNPKEPMYGDEVCIIEEELSIGEAKGTEEYMFSQIIDVGVDDDENIYILDFKEAHIKVLNKKGEYLRTIGKRGQGPGEIQRPMNLVITPGGKILVNDRGARFIHYFTLSGDYIRSMRQTKLLLFSRPKVDSQDNIVARHTITDTDRTWTFVLKKFDSELNELYTIFSYEHELSPGVLNLFSPRCYWEITRDDTIIWGYANKYEFQIYNGDGRPIRKIIKDYSPVIITKEEKQEWIKSTYGEQGVPPDIKVSWKPHHNAFQFMNIDDAGRIFVQTYEKTNDGSGYYNDVFNSEGKYIAKIPLKSQPWIWKRGKLYTIEEDEEGYQVVKRYKVTWKY